MKLFLGSSLRAILRDILSEEDYKKVLVRLKDVRRIDAIPEGYIYSYMKKHDPVYQNNLTNLIEDYHHHLGIGGDYECSNRSQ